MEEMCLQTSKTGGRKGRGKRGRRPEEIWGYEAADENRGAIITFSGTESQAASSKILPFLPPEKREPDPNRGRSRRSRESGRGKRDKSSNQIQNQEEVGAIRIDDGSFWTNHIPPLLPRTEGTAMGGFDSFQVARGEALSTGEQSRLISFVETHSRREAEMNPRTSQCIGEFTSTSSLERGASLNLLGDVPCRKDPTTGSSQRKGVRKTLNEIRQQAAQTLDIPTAASIGEDASLAVPGRPKVQKRYHREQLAATAEEFTHWLPDMKIVWDWQPYCPYASFSPKLSHIYEDERHQVSSLPLFGSSHVTACTDRSVADYYDLVINVGGSVWALDWCPKRQGWQFEGFKKEFLAVGVHPDDSPVHRLGEPIFGRGLIQIWAFSASSFFDVQICSKSGEHSQTKKRIQGRPKAMTVYQAHQISQKTGVDEADFTQKGLVLRDSLVQESGMSGKAGAYALEEDTAKKNSAQAVHFRRPRRDLNVVAVVPGGDESCKDRRNSTGGNVVDINRGEVESSASEMTLATKEVFDLPQMVLGLAHDGGVTWDAKWQPATDLLGIDKKELHRLGYLAGLFGDGSLQVFDVPLPSIVNHFKACESRDSDIDPVIAKINPVFKCSGLPCRGAKSMPLILEWSSSPHDRLLVGCHDGVVALWKFSPISSTDKDTCPLMCFVADSAPIRAIAWSPADGSGTESENVIATAGHSGRLQLWDLRDPFHPIWDLILSKGGCILSIDWLSSPRCIVLSMDDGSIRTLSLDMAASDTPVTGKPCTKTLGYGLHSYFCSSFAIWTVHVSRATGLAIWGGEDGLVIQFQLTEKSIKQERVRTRHSHSICGQFAEDTDSGVLSIISQNAPILVQMKKFRTDNSQTPLSKLLITANSGSLVDDQAVCKRSPSRQVSQSLSKSVKRKGINQQRTADVIQPSVEIVDSLAIVPYDASLHEKLCPSSLEESFTVDDTHVSRRDKQHKGGKNCVSVMATLDGGVAMSSSQNMVDSQSAGQLIVEKLPPKSVSVHRVRWNQNKGSDSWLCFGGAAGIVRCRVIYPRA